jgi:HEAT repeat protein
VTVKSAGSDRRRSAPQHAGEGGRAPGSDVSREPSVEPSPHPAALGIIGKWCLAGTAGLPHGRGHRPRRDPLSGCWIRSDASWWAGCSYAGAFQTGENMSATGIAVDVEEVLRGLASADYETNRRAVLALRRTRVKVTRVLPVLLGMLRDPSDSQFRSYVSIALEVHSRKSPAAVRPLLEGMHDENPSLRGWAARTMRAVGPIAAPIAVPALIDGLRDDDGWVRECAAEGLGGIGPGAAVAVPDLITLLATEDKWVRETLCATLSAIGAGAATAVPALLRVLANDDPSIRCKAIEALGNIGLGASTAVPRLLDALTDEEVNVRASAAAALCQFFSERDLSYYLRMYPQIVISLSISLQDPEHQVRRSAARALGAIAPRAKDAVPLLIRALDDCHPFVRETAVEELGDIGLIPQESVPSILRLLDDRNAFVRAHAALTIGKLKGTNPDAIRALVLALKDPHERIRSWAGGALEDLGYRQATHYDDVIPDLVIQGSDRPPLFAMLYPEAHANIMRLLNGEKGDKKATRRQLSIFREFFRSGSFRKVAEVLGYEDHSGVAKNIKCLEYDLGVSLICCREDGRKRSEPTDAGKALHDWIAGNLSLIR